MEDIHDGAVPVVGSPVLFTIGSDNKGRLRARMMQVGRLPPSNGGFMKKRKVCDFGSIQDSPKGFEPFDGQVLEGEVASWKSPWGWIRAPGFGGGDLFAHKEDVESGEELDEGQHVTFTVGRDPKSGRWRALQICTGEG